METLWANVTSIQIPLYVNLVNSDHKWLSNFEARFHMLFDWNLSAWNLGTCCENYPWPQMVHEAPPTQVFRYFTTQMPCPSDCPIKFNTDRFRCHYMYFLRLISTHLISEINQFEMIMKHELVCHSRGVTQKMRQTF